MNYVVFNRGVLKVEHDQYKITPEGEITFVYSTFAGDIVSVFVYSSGRLLERRDLFCLKTEANVPLNIDKTVITDFRSQ
jgi:hypothetical protein